MLLAILGIGLTTGGVSTQATLMAIAITVGWGIISAAYLAYNSRKQGKQIIAAVPPRHLATSALASRINGNARRSRRWLVFFFFLFLKRVMAPTRLLARSYSDVGPVRDENQDTTRLLTPADPLIGRNARQPVGHC